MAESRHALEQYQTGLVPEGKRGGKRLNPADGHSSEGYRQPVPGPPHPCRCLTVSTIDSTTDPPAVV
jgi:hypothetical protein